MMIAIGDDGGGDEVMVAVTTMIAIDDDGGDDELVVMAL